MKASPCPATDPPTRTPSTSLPLDAAAQVEDHGDDGAPSAGPLVHGAQAEALPFAELPPCPTPLLLVLRWRYWTWVTMKNVAVKALVCSTFDADVRADSKAKVGAEGQGLEV